MEVRALLESEQDECIALWRTVWPGDNDAYFRRYFEGDVEWLPYYTQVAVDDGRILSAVHICKRTVACGDFRLQMGGIANVATLPQHRGKGLNSACLRSAIAVMEADALDFSLLFTGISGYYARQGFANLPRARLRGTLRAGLRSSEGAVAVREARAEDLPQLFAVYNAYNAARPIAVQRTPAYWRDWIGLKPQKLLAGEPPLVALNHAGDVLGYVCYQLNFYRGHQITEDYAYVSEYGAVAPADGGERSGRTGDGALSSGEGRGDGVTSDNVANVLLREVAVRALKSGKRELHLSIALDSSIRSAMAGLCETIGENVTESAMARLLHRDNLLRSFLMEWNDRWVEAGRPPSAVVFETPYGPVRLDASGRFLKAEAADTGETGLSQAELLGLLFGTLEPRHVSDDPERLQMLGCLFPPRDGVYWSADGF